MSKMWSYGDPIEQNPGYRMLKDGEIIPEDAESYMTCTWEPVGPSAPGAPYMEPNEARANAEFHFPMRVKLSLHDGHYRALEAKGTEPIERMEALVCRDIPEDLHRIAKRNLNMAMASKHQDRAGEKSGEAWEKELQKDENYLHRAWSGRWIG